MRHQQINRYIAGVLAVGLLLSPLRAYALYSPTLSKYSAQIRAHVMASRQKNGAGSLMNAIDKFTAKEDVDKKTGKTTSLPYKFINAMRYLTTDTMIDIVIPADAGENIYGVVPYIAYLDPIFMILFDVVPSTATITTSCLRDDIFTLEAMKDQVTTELVKSYLLFDDADGDALWQDYNLLRNHAAFLKRYGMNSNYPMPDTVFNYRSADDSKNLPFIECKGATPEERAKNCPQYFGGRMPNVTEYFFPGGVNYYEGQFCAGEWLPALMQVSESAQTLWGIATAPRTGWSDIWKMAQARAVQRAAEWIRNNAITLSISGSGSATGEPLLTGEEVENSIKSKQFTSPSMDRFVGYWRSQEGSAAAMLAPLLPFFDPQLYVTATMAMAYAAAELAKNIGIGNGMSPEALQKGVTLFVSSDPTSIASKARCAYYNIMNGTFSGCTEEQLKLQAENTCRLCVNPQEVASPGERVAKMQQAVAAKAAEIDLAATANQWNFVLNGVGEKSIMDADLILLDMNLIIKRGYEAAGSGEKALPDFCGQLLWLSKTQASNKSSMKDLPPCK